MTILKDLKLEDITCQKELWIFITFIINGKNFYNLPTDSDIKRYEEIRKKTTEQGED